VTQKRIDSDYLRNIVNTKGDSIAFACIARILPEVLYQVMILGQEALEVLTVRSVKLRLDDGHFYKLKFSHELHALVLYRMQGTRNAVQVATFDNLTPPATVWPALHPARAARKVA